VTYDEIARATGLSRRTVIRAMRPALEGPDTHPLRTFVRARPAYRSTPSGAAARTANVYLVRMDDPLPGRAADPSGSRDLTRPEHHRPPKPPGRGVILSPGGQWPTASEPDQNGVPAPGVSLSLHDDDGSDDFSEPGKKKLVSFLVSAGMAEGVALWNIRSHGCRKVLEAATTVARLYALGRIRSFPAALHSFLNCPGRWSVPPGNTPASGKPGPDSLSTSSQDSVPRGVLEAAEKHALLFAKELFGQDLPPSDPAVLAFKESLLEALCGVLYSSIPRRRIPRGTAPETFFRSMWNWLQASLPRLLPGAGTGRARLACVAAMRLYFPPPGVTTLASILGVSTQEATALLKAASAPGPHTEAAEVLADAFEQEAWAQPVPAARLTTPTASLCTRPT